MSPHLRAVADSHAGDTDAERTAELHAAFADRFGSDPDMWPEYARLAHDRVTDHIHHCYGPKEAA